ncbi:MAG: ATP synthase F1 subunit gamma [Candidatus Cloacimonadota bacterium]|nr:ATP synthase F1 subunit gamma [Candidatus Cloacimonadota bacterium]
MGNIKDIKTRIESITSTRQITKAMKMVAASKLRKAQEKILAARPYADYINDMLVKIKFKNLVSEHKVFNPAEFGKRLILIVTADRGLCGAFNYNIIKQAAEVLENEKPTEIVCVGKKGFDFFKKQDFTMKTHFVDLFNEMDFSKSVDICSSFFDDYLKGIYNEVHVVYNEFKSAIEQNIVSKKLLPIEPHHAEKISPLDYIYEPSAEEIIEELAHKYIDVEIWRILLESSAAEQGGRMTAMDNATENASDLISSLTLQYNRERQAKITTEIIEIVSGAEAINQ